MLSVICFILYIHPHTESTEYTIEPVRGKILSDGGYTLAENICLYDIYFDPLAGGLPEGEYRDKIHPLCDSLSALLKNKTDEEYFRYIDTLRVKKKKYIKIANDIDSSVLLRLKTFPIFNEGKDAGLIINKDEFRSYPNYPYAARTIGGTFLSKDLNFVKQGTIVGLEGAFNKELSGKPGILRKKWIFYRYQRLPAFINRILFKLSYWEKVTKEVENGADITSTINLPMQRRCHQYLNYELEKLSADWGTLIVMEKTGAIKAMVNLKKTDSTYLEAYNYAITLLPAFEQFASYPSITEVCNKINIPIKGFGKPELIDEKFVKLTPVHIVSYFNGINNNGVFINPCFIESFQHSMHVVPVQTEIIAENIVKSNDLQNIKSDFALLNNLSWLQTEFPYFEYRLGTGKIKKFVRIYIGINNTYTVVAAISVAESGIKQLDMEGLDLLIEEE